MKKLVNLGKYIVFGLCIPYIAIKERTEKSGKNKRIKNNRNMAVSIATCVIRPLTKAEAREIKKNVVMEA